MGTIKQSLFAIPAAHRRTGAGDSLELEEAQRVWILLAALRREKHPAPRTLATETLARMAKEIRVERVSRQWRNSDAGAGPEEAGRWQWR